MHASILLTFPCWFLIYSFPKKPLCFYEFPSIFLLIINRWLTSCVSPAVGAVTQAVEQPEASWLHFHMVLNSNYFTWAPVSPSVTWRWRLSACCRVNISPDATRSHLKHESVSLNLPIRRNPAWLKRKMIQIVIHDYRINLNGSVFFLSS